MKPFNLEEAKAGAKICTRDGRPVRIICYDRIDEAYPIVALITNDFDEPEDIEDYTIDGYYISIKLGHDYDLMLAD